MKLLAESMLDVSTLREMLAFPWNSTESKARTGPRTPAGEYEKRTEAHCARCCCWGAGEDRNAQPLLSSATVTPTIARALSIT